MAKDNFVENIADIEEDFPQWYTDVCKKTQLVDYGPVKGTMVIRPYGYAIWENIQKELDARFKKTGAENAYFPLLIPMSFMTKESEHVEGFAPEVAVVTHAGGEELAEPLVVRPTSETIIGNMYSKWIQSYRDLPVKMNQWANVMRWEKTTRPFLRTSEFLWQEGHTAHATEEEAEEETMQMLGVYKEFAENVLAIPVICGKKTEKEKFAGAVATYGMEAMMKDGKSLQSGTSHYLGQNFAKAFDIKFLDKDGVQKYAYTSSWGVSTVWKFNEWEMKGVPVRIEVGPRDLEAGKVILFRRDTLEKCECLKDSTGATVLSLLETVQKDMLESARVRRDERIIKAADIEGILAGVEGGNFVKAGWCGCRECEDKIKEKTAATARVMLDELEDEKCAVCGKKAKHTVYFARAY